MLVKRALNERKHLEKEKDAKLMLMDRIWGAHRSVKVAPINADAAGSSQATSAVQVASASNLAYSLGMARMRRCYH